MCSASRVQKRAGTVYDRCQLEDAIARQAASVEVVEIGREPR